MAGFCLTFLVMKKTYLIPLTAAACIAVSIAAPAHAASTTNSFETFDGSVNLRGIGTVLASKVPESDVRIAATVNSQLSGAPVQTPSTNAITPVSGTLNRPLRITNRQIIEAVRGLGNAGGMRIKWGYYFAPGNVPKTTLLIYNSSGIQNVIPEALLTLNVGWAQNYAGVYNGTASLTSQIISAASGTSVSVSGGRLNGLTTISGRYLGYLNFSGVGRFTADSRQQLTASARVSAGNNSN